MAFKRELKTEYISESDNVWIDNPFKETDGKEKIQLIGTWCACTVTDEETDLLRSTSFLIPPHIAFEDKESQELVELHFDMCEHSLKRDLKKRLREEGMELVQRNVDSFNASIDKAILNELRANNII